MRLDDLSAIVVAVRGSVTFEGPFRTAVVIGSLMGYPGLVCRVAGSIARFTAERRMTTVGLATPPSSRRGKRPEIECETARDAHIRAATTGSHCSMRA